MRSRLGSAALVIGLFGQFMLLAASPVRADELDEAYDRGIQLFQVRRYGEALPFFERALLLAERRFGPQDPRIAVDINNLGEVYRQLGRFDEAGQLFERALRLDGNVGEDGPSLATTMNNLALVYRAQGRLNEAQSLYSRSLAILERRLGPNHPDVARSLGNLGLLHLERGEPGKALPLAERGLAIAEKQLGPDDPVTRLLKTTTDRSRTMTTALAPEAAPAPPGKPMALFTQPATPAPSRRAAPPAPAADPPPSQTPTTADGRVTAPPTVVTAMAPAAPARSAPSGARSYTLHLSSLRSSEAAQAEWARVAKSYPSLATLEQHPPQRVEIPGKGVFWRVLVGRYTTRSDAMAACEQLRSQGGTCIVLPL